VQSQFPLFFIEIRVFSSKIVRFLAKGHKNVFFHWSAKDLLIHWEKAKNTLLGSFFRVFKIKENLLCLYDMWISYTL